MFVCICCERMSHFVIECMEIDVFAFLIVNIFHL